VGSGQWGGGIQRHIRVEREVKLGARLSEGIWWVWLAHSYDAGCCVALVLPPAALSALQMRGRRAVTMAGWQARRRRQPQPLLPGARALVARV
jgi:hypothetical protein